MNVYLESSAALRDVLEGDHAGEIRRLVGAAENVAVSRLTLAEVARVMASLRVLEPAAAARVGAREAELISDSESWAVLPIDDAVLARVAQPFPVEPVRVLDAVHLASIERFGTALPNLVVVSTDDRIRRNAEVLGFEVRP
jgi:predicted nucleic acid-binding protein